jgi:hypothetical protein
VSTLSSGSKEKSQAISDLCQLYRLRIEENKNDDDYDVNANKRDADADVREREEAFRQSQLVEQVKDRYFRLGMDAAAIILPLVLYAVWMKKGFKFEETGTFTSTTFRGLFNRFRPTKS